MSYATMEGVIPYVRRLLAGETAFNAVTNPTGAEVEAFIAQVDAELDVALSQYSFVVPVANPTVVAMLAGWANRRVAQLVELTQPGAGFSEDDNLRVRSLTDGKTAVQYIGSIAEALDNLGAGRVGSQTGAVFTGHSDPLFGRGQFESRGRDGLR